MDTSFRLFPESASNFAHSVDVLYACLLGMAAFFTILICAMILYFGIRYRRGAVIDRANAPDKNVWLEVTWIAIPLLITTGMFVGGAAVYFQEREPPINPLEIDVVGKQWMWKLQHAEGKAEINTLHVPNHQAVRLRMISEDVIHSFYVPAFRVKQDVLPGRYTQMWFEPTKTGTYHLFCAEYCGTEHSKMQGTVVVMEPDEYADWLAGETGERPEVAGGKLFERYRCNTCHKPDGTGNGPSLMGIFGSKVPLAGGGSVVADEQYLRDSIVEPKKQVVAGFQPLMPSFRGQLDEAQILKIIAYLKSTKATSDAGKQPQ